MWRYGKPGFVAAIEDPNISALVELGLQKLSYIKTSTRNEASDNNLVHSQYDNIYKSI